MFMPAARLGLHYYRGGIERYVSRLGINHAKRLFLTAEKIDGKEMLRIGYLTGLVAPDQLDAEIDRLAGVLAGNAPNAMRGMKHAINEFARGALDAEAAEQRHRDSLTGAEIREGSAAFAQKRKPQF
jgi:enoyl-CoA hydratase/carnithine racemase